MSNLKLVTDSTDSNKIHETFSYGVIYVYSIPDESHKGRLKIGSATVTSPAPTQDDINRASHERIKQQTKTADILYGLEHAELAISTDGHNCFLDHDVHQILIRSGYDRKSENINNTHSEWFEISLDVAKNAIKAAKEGRSSLRLLDTTNTRIHEFIFRPNQRDAIDRTIKAIKQGRKQFLWNAKMRFGKTSAAMQVAKEKQMKRVLILTHRPSVSDDWYDDFNTVFFGTEYEYSSRTKGEHICTLVKTKKPFVYFASLQDLRLSKRVVQDEASKTQAVGFEKNEEIFDTVWDMLIVDEAHEGTQSDLGETTISKISANFTLKLSGTPFNIMHKYEESDIYTWDYVMEQEEKLTWDERFPGRPNPYAELPSLSMFTYDIDKFASHIGNIGDDFSDSLDGAFKFHEFFRVNKDDDGNDMAEFVHESMVRKFLDLLVNDKLDTKFPYATEEYRNYNKHTLWLLPNRVKVIEAMEKLLKDHSVFGSGSFGIVNISGNNINDDEDKDAKEKVMRAIKNHDYSITLTGQRLTTGASVPEWTAVFMLSDTSSATTYLQTAFRCQTPARIDGKIKTHGYIFDFAPDRTLRLIAEAIELNHKSGKINTPDQKEAMAKFLNFCPILAAEGGNMKPYDVRSMLEQLKKAIIDRVSRNGFDDPKLYNDELLQLNDVDLEKFNELKQIVGSSSSEKVNEIEVNNLGMSDLQVSAAEEAERKLKQKKEIVPEEKEALEKLKKAREQKQSAISILRAVSIRMPMMVYGANVSLHTDIDLQKFIDLVDEESWKEFMPAGLTKEKFKDFVKYYDEEVFRGVTKNIRAKAFDCDQLLPTERIYAISEIFKTFKNPDKETVLTPWNVVNMHLAKTFGGHDFSDNFRDKHGKPRWVSSGVDTSIWSQEDAKVLEINSKSGLYPLLATYNLYSRKLVKSKKPEDKISNHTWNEILKNNIYVLCKSPMAKSITIRTLAGYKGAKMNVIYIEDLVKKLQKKDEYKDYNLNKELQEKFLFKDKDMKFTAIIGNPPYQEIVGGKINNSLSKQLYPEFIIQAITMQPEYLSLITPSRWFTGNAQDRSFVKLRSFIKNNNNISNIFNYLDSSEVFKGVNISGGVNHFLHKNGYSGDVSFCEILNGSSTTYTRPLFEPGLDIVLPMNSMVSILRKVKNNKFKSMSDIVTGRNPFGIPATESGLNKIAFDFGKVGTDIKVLCAYENMKYISDDKIKRNKALSNNWKVFTSKMNGGAGTLLGGKQVAILGRTFLMGPGSICSNALIAVGNYTQRSQAENLNRYMKTKFFRFMLGIMKISQVLTSNIYKYVPQQDFTKNSDIDWIKRISDIDKQLYTKYKLNADEINFIETHVKTMD